MTGRTQEAQWRWLHQIELRLRLFSPFLLALLTLAILVSAAIYLLGRPADGFEWVPLNGKVEEIDPTAPAAAALKLGDAVVELDGVPLAQVNSLYAGKQPGDQVILTMRRDGEERAVPIRLIAPSLAVLVSRLEPLLIALCFWALGTIVLAFKPADSTARLFYWFSQVSSGALAFGALSTTRVFWASQVFSLLLWFIGPLTIHFHLRFPKTTSMPHQRFLLTLLYGLAVVGSLLGLTEDSGWIRTGSLQLSSTAVRVYLGASLMAAVVLLAIAYRRAASSQAQRQIRLVVLGAALALIPIGGLALLPEALLGQPLIPYSAAFLFLLAIPLAYGYSLIRYRLLHFDRPISRSLVYVFLIALLAIFYSLLSTGLSALLPHAFAREPWIQLALALVVAVTFVPFRDQLQKLIDWVFYGGWYNYRTAVQQLSQVLDEVTDAPSFARILVDSLQKTLKLECACMLLPDQAGAFSARGSTNFCPFQCEGLIRLDANGTLVQFLQRERLPITDDLLRQRMIGRLLTRIEQRILACAQPRLWVPLVGRERLLGILVLGPKQGDDLFDGEDFQILEVVRRQASVTIQNISLLRALQQHATDLERLHQQLLRAREEERKRLARELHDEIIQALVGLHYELSHSQVAAAPTQDGQVEQLQQQVHQIMAALRNVCTELRPPALDSLGLVSAVRSRLRELEVEGAPAG